MARADESRVGIAAFASGSTAGLGIGDGTGGAGVEVRVTVDGFVGERAGVSAGAGERLGVIVGVLVAVRGGVCVGVSVRIGVGVLVAVGELVGVWCRFRPAGERSRPMAGSVKAVPEGYHTVTPYLIIDGAAAAIEFYKKAFGAVEVMRMPGPDGKLGHAEIKIGDSHVMLADENPEMNARSPRSLGGSPISIALYVDDVDKVVDRAVAAGAKLERPVEDKFYGDRMGGIEDPFGHHWYVGTHIEDVTPEEMKKRIAAMSPS